MKVVLLNDQLNAGGAERVLVNMANLLHRNGVIVKVVLFLKPATLDHLLNREIEVIYLQRRYRFDISAMLHLKREICGFDILHIHSRYNLRYVMLTKFLTGWRKTKIVFQEHVPAFEKLDAVTAYFFQKIDAYVAVQATMCTWINQLKVIPHDQIYLLPNIVSKPDKLVDVEAPNLKKLVMVANFRRVKNQLLALKILQNLSADFCLDFYGTIDEADYYNEIQDQIGANKLTERVSIKGGVTNIYPLLNQYDLAIHTAINETGPLVLLEYLNAGLPFLTYDTGEVVSKVKNELPEFVINHFDEGKWASKIEEVLNAPNYRQAVQPKMKHIIDENYTETAYWKQLINIYQKTLQAF